MVQESQASMTNAFMFYNQRKRQVANGAKASKASRDADDLDVRLDLALGAVHDLTAYHDCIACARSEGARMTPNQRARALELSKNPK